MPSLIQDTNFQIVLDKVAIRVSLDSLSIPDLEVEPSFQDAQFSESKLFTQGTALAFSGGEAERMAALKIAHYLLLSAQSEKAHRLGYVLLRRLRNKASAQLALDKNLVPKSEPEGFFSLLRQGSVDISALTIVNEEKLYLNQFQADFIGSLSTHQQVAVSAPTSAGKSFIVERWLAEALSKGGSGDVALIVPTRALIHQMETDMRAILSASNNTDVQVVTVPSEAFLSRERRNLLVFTQERFHAYLNLNRDEAKISAIIVDEAQKIADGARGVLLQQVIETAARRNPDAKFVFLTPASKNPEILLLQRLGTGEVIKSGEVTVGQNLYWVTQRPRTPKSWNLSLVRPSGTHRLGSFDLEHKPAKVTERLSYVAFHIGGNEIGNIVYVNGASDAEKAATQLAELMKGSGFQASDELKELAAYAAVSIHPKYRLVDVLSQGIAFHYGNMPLLLRSEIERLFSEGEIRYLVCTSTLVEGVNTACRNLFVRGPERGRGQKMDSLDFWNLAGRAGRWGREFEGNIFCVDADNKSLWLGGEPPRERDRFTIVRAIDGALSDSSAIDSGLTVDSPRDWESWSPELESAVHYLYDRYIEDGLELESSFPIDRQWLDSVKTRIDESISQIEINHEVIRANPGINPRYMKRLLAYFRERGRSPEEYIPPDPDSNDAVERLTKVFMRTYSNLGSGLGPAKRSFGLALLVTNWMRGYPLRRIIESQVQYDRKKNPSRVLATTIRNVLSDIETHARYRAPKYLACYCDVLSQYLYEAGRDDLLDDLEDFSLYLEFGASKVTQISLMSLGLSRGAAIALSEYLVGDDLTREQVIAMLAGLDVESLDIPRVVQREILAILE